MLFSGCNPKQIKEKGADVSSFFENINASFIARFGQLEAKGFFTFTPDRLTLEFTTPKTISGLKIQADSQSVTFSINDLSVTKQSSVVTQRLNAAAVFSALNSARLTGASKNSDGQTVISGEGFEITLDGENRVKHIIIPAKKIEIDLDW